MRQEATQDESQVRTIVGSEGRLLDRLALGGLLRREGCLVADGGVAARPHGCGVRATSPTLVSGAGGCCPAAGGVSCANEARQNHTGVC